MIPPSSADHEDVAKGGPRLNELRTIAYECYEAVGYYVYLRKPTLPYGVECLEVRLTHSLEEACELIRFWCVLRETADRLGLRPPTAKTRLPQGAVQKKAGTK
jgi:hypothetical protein